MSRAAWVCTLCTSETATLYCNCEERKTPLCKGCIGEHVAKNTTVQHPLLSLGQIQPEDMHRAAKAEIMKNVTEIDRCKRELTDGVKSTIEALEEYRENQLIALNTLRAEYMRNAQIAFAEVDNPANQEPDALISPWAKDIIAYNGDPDTLKHFEFHVDVSYMKEGLPGICNYITRENQGKFVLPSIKGDIYTLYDVQTQSTSSRAIFRRFSDGIRLCFIAKNELLIVGSDPSSTDAHVLNTLQVQLSEIQPMHTKRILPGLIEAGGAAYVFGGDCVECEKYHLGQKQWLPLPNVAKKIYAFSPCRVENDIYLIETACYNYQIFDLTTQEFRTVEIPIDNIRGNSLSILVDDEILIVTSSKQIGRLNIRESRFRVSSFTDAGEHPISQCQPVLFAGEVYYVSWNTGNLNAYNIEANVGIRKINAPN